MEFRNLVPQRNISEEILTARDINADFPGIILVLIGDLPIGYIVWNEYQWIYSSSIDCDLGISDKDLNDLLIRIMDEIDGEVTFKIIDF